MMGAQINVLSEVLKTKFNISEGDIIEIVGADNNPHTFSQDKIMDCNRDDSNTAALVLNIMTGACEVEKLPWKPDLGELFYYPAPTLELGYYETEWKEDEYNYRVLNTVGCFKEIAEAQRKTIEIFPEAAAWIVINE